MILSKRLIAMVKEVPHSPFMNGKAVEKSAVFLLCKEGENMQIYEYLARTDLPTLQRIMKTYNFNPDKPKRSKEKKKNKKSTIELGDTVENLMKHSAYKRHRGALRQIRWDK